MCIRFDKETGRLVNWSHKVQAWVPLDEWKMGLDTYPGYEAPVIQVDWERGRAARMAKWGLQPFWAKDPLFGKKNAYNARAETVAVKPSFREPFRKRRCIVPATAFYERKEGRWLRISMQDDEAFGMAGLYEEPNELSESQTFTLVTTEPNAFVGQIQDRMPVILSPDDYDTWLDPLSSQDILQDLLRPCPDELLRLEDAGPVGRT